MKKIELELMKNYRYLSKLEQKTDWCWISGRNCSWMC